MNKNYSSIKNLLIIALIVALLVLYTNDLFSQADFGQFSGNISIEAQTYTKDSIINALDAPEKILTNSSLNMFYRLKGFEVGMRFEAFLNPIYGIDPQYQGSGIAYKNLTYRGENFEATAGNFYEQFGSGVILRSYYDPQLGVDNSIEGVRAVIKPTNGINIKAIVGTMRKFWTQSNSVIRGADIEMTTQSVLPNLLPNDWNINAGFSLLSKFEEDNSSSLILPLNELSWSARLSLFTSLINIETEFAFTNNHPQITNSNTYNEGNATIINISYLNEGIGSTLSFHRIDNFDLRGERNARGNTLTMNYVPSITKQHTFNEYSLFPFATQLNGEIGIQWELSYYFPENSLLGGEYGGNINFNFSQVNAIRKDALDEFTYTSDFFAIGDTMFFRDINVEYNRTFSMNLDATLRYAYITNNKDLLFFSGAPYYGKVYAHLIGIESNYIINKDYALHCKLENTLQTQDSVLHNPDNDNGDWISGLAELSIQSKFLVSTLLRYNYGNEFEDRRILYYNLNATYLMDATRISLSYGRMSGGILCVGGVCRQVPSTNGFYFVLTSSF